MRDRVPALPGRVAVQALSILYLRCAKYKIPSPTGDVEYEKCLSILYLRCWGGVVGTKVSDINWTFNSLFEMRIGD